MDEDRRAKLERLRESGIDPYPARLPGRAARGSVHAAHGELEAGEETDAAYRVAGRLTGRREMGKAAFLDVTDRSGKIQVQARRDVLGDEIFEGADRGSTSATSWGSRAPPSRAAAAS